MCECDSCIDGRCEKKYERKPRGPLDIPKYKKVPEDGTIPDWCPELKW